MDPLPLVQAGASEDVACTMSGMGLGIARGLYPECLMETKETLL